MEGLANSGRDSRLTVIDGAVQGGTMAAHDVHRRSLLQEQSLGMGRRGAATVERGRRRYR